MEEIDVNKAIITGINIIILLGLPCMLAWHIKKARSKSHLSDEWMVQILIIFVYAIAISAEIPALWARWISYYQLNLKLPQLMYVLNTWDRYLHLFLYVVLFMLTYTFTRNKVPKIIRDTFN